MTAYVLAGGCFWCLDAVYRKIKGVETVITGYAGGRVDNPSYSQVMTGGSGHAESAKIIFDESVIPSITILDIFFFIHDPTSLNRQGADIGTQYRSAMFYADDAQKQLFEEARDRAQKLRDSKIVTEVTKLDTFTPAEQEHQNYYARIPGNPYCALVIDPKLAAAKAAYHKWFVG